MRKYKGQVPYLPAQRPHIFAVKKVSQTGDAANTHVLICMKIWKYSELCASDYDFKWTTNGILRH